MSVMRGDWERTCLLNGGHGWSTGERSGERRGRSSLKVSADLGLTGKNKTLKKSPDKNGFRR